MIFNRRVITKFLDLINLKNHNDNFTEIHTDLTDHESRIIGAQSDITTHKASDAAHPAEHVTYSGPIVGATNIKEGLDSVKQQLDTSVMAGDSSVAAAQAAIDVEGVDHRNLKARIDSDVVKLNTQLADTALARIANEDATGIDSVTFAALTTKRRQRRFTNREIAVIGDSHTWGQGGAEGDWMAGSTPISYHYGQIYNKGYGNRLKEYLSAKHEFYESMVSFENVGAWPAESVPHYTSKLTDVDTNTTDPNMRSDKINLLSGIVTGQTSVAINPSDPNFFNPEARGLTADKTFGLTVNQQKFGTGLAYFLNETPDNYVPKEDLAVRIVPDISYTSEIETFTVHKHNTAIYYGFVTSDWSNQFIRIAGRTLPDWLVAGVQILVEGYGLVKVDVITKATSPASYTLFLKKADGSAITQDLSAVLYPGKPLYYYKQSSFNFLYSMQKHATRMFLNVLRGPNAAIVKISFKTPYDGGLRSVDLLDTRASTTASDYHSNKAGYPKVYIVDSGGNLVQQTSPIVEIDSSYITINAYNSSPEDTVFCIDWGFKQKGILRFEYGGFDVSSTPFGTSGSRVFATRGFFFDGNVVKVNGMGSHTTGAMLGSTTCPAGHSGNHISGLLRYAVTCPSLLIIQAPIVNEYLAQTPLSTFTSNLTAIINQFRAHRNPAYPGATYTDVLLISTIGGKAQEFDTDTAAVKYEDYFSALRSYALANGFGMVDFRQWFKNQVAAGILDYEMIYDDDIHPSSFANEFIAKELFKIVDLTM